MLNVTNRTWISFLASLGVRLYGCMYVLYGVSNLVLVCTAHFPDRTDIVNTAIKGVVELLAGAAVIFLFRYAVIVLAMYSVASGFIMIHQALSIPQIAIYYYIEAGVFALLPTLLTWLAWDSLR